MLERSHFRISGNNNDNYGQLNDSETKQNRRISFAGVFGGRQTSYASPVNVAQNLQQKPQPSYDFSYESVKAQDNSNLMPTNDFDSDELFLRDFFPEVWLFQDYIFG